MKLVDALHEYENLRKRITRKIQQIQDNSSALDNERYPYGDEKQQRKEVKSMVQSVGDLMERYIWLKVRIELTNLLTIISVGEKRLSLTEILIIQRYPGNPIKEASNALNRKHGEQKLQRYPVSSGEKRPQVIWFFDEEEKQRNINKLDIFYTSLSPRLQTTNAITDLIEEHPILDFIEKEKKKQPYLEELQNK